MVDRTTAKSNIVGLNVPSVTNAIMTEMLNDNICDNVVFRKDLTVAQASGLSNITVDFTGKDRVDLTRTGGNLVITVAGIEDGERKFLLITKSALQPVTWVGVTDITPYKTYANDATVVLYEIVRKGTLYVAKAWLETIKNATESKAGILPIASDAEANALSVDNRIITPAKIPRASDIQRGLIEIATGAEVADLTDALKAVVPARIPKASTTQQGIAQHASNAQVDAGTDSLIGGESIVVQPSQLKRKYDAALAKIGMELWWYGKFVYASNSLTKYAGPTANTISFGTDFGYGSYQFVLNEALNKTTAIPNAVPCSASIEHPVVMVTLENTLTEGLLSVKTAGDTDLFITVFKLI